MTATMKRTWTMPEIRRANADAGLYFFSPGAMRFFRSRVHDRVYQGPGGVFFVTSEQGPDDVRRYTVREFDPETARMTALGGDVDGFQRYATRSGAHAAAYRAAAGK